MFNKNELILLSAYALEGRGINPGTQQTTILKYDENTHRGVTQSGRVYELVGAPGYDSDAMYVWGVWLNKTGNPENIDITSEYKI